MITRTQQQIILSIAQRYRDAYDFMQRETNSPEQQESYREKMYCYRQCLESCGLTLNQVITFITGDVKEKIELLFKPPEKSKGAQLSELLDAAEANNSAMRNIFLKNNHTTPELRLLPDVDKEEWYRLKKISDDLSNAMCELINPFKK